MQALQHLETIALLGGVEPYNPRAGESPISNGDPHQGPSWEPGDVVNEVVEPG